MRVNKTLFYTANRKWCYYIKKNRACFISLRKRNEIDTHTHTYTNRERQIDIETSRKRETTERNLSFFLAKQSKYSYVLSIYWLVVLGVSNNVASSALIDRRIS